MAEFYTKLKRPPRRQEKMCQISLVETRGYMTARQKVEMLTNAGQRLLDYRREQYDFGTDEEIDDNFLDPTRNPNFDLSDASLLAEQTSNRLKAQDAENKKIAAANAAEEKRKAEEEHDAAVIEDYKKSQKMPLE